MGMFGGRLTFFAAGFVCGIYTTQNYKVPDVSKVLQEAWATVLQLEERMRKR